MGHRNIHARDRTVERSYLRDGEVPDLLWDREVGPYRINRDPGRAADLDQVGKRRRGHSDPMHAGVHLDLNPLGPGGP